MTTTDPVQLLIDAGAIPQSPLDPNSRYQGVAVARHVSHPGDPGTPYLLRRFIPARRDIAIAAEHLVRCGERPDTLANALLGDPGLYWRLADANAVIDPLELSDTPGERILVPRPVGA